MTRRITIIGVGALGSHAVQFLRNVDADLRICDFDRTEQRNVASQFHAKSTVRKLKVHGLQQTMDFLFGRRILALTCSLELTNAKEVLGGSDLIIDCVDNGVTRRLIQGFALEHAIPCLHGALAAGGAFGRVAWSPGFTVDDEPAGAATPTCENGEFLPFIALVSALLAQSAQEFMRTGKCIGYQVSPTNVLSI